MYCLKEITMDKKGIGLKVADVITVYYKTTSNQKRIGNL